MIYPEDVETPTASLKLTNIIINNVLYLHGAKFACFYAKNVYLATPMYRSEYVKINLMISQLNLLMNITCKPSLKMDGFILKLSEGDMAYPRVES